MPEYNIVYEDNAILVIDKSHGYACQTASEDPNLQNDFPDYHYITRVDQPGAGLVLMAKNQPSSAVLTRIMNTGGLDKKYLVLVEGKPKTPNGEASHYLMKVDKKSFVNPKGKICNINWKTTKELDRYTFLEVEIKQGRFHQVRAQLAELGFPIKGDLKYGSRRSNKEGGIYLCCTHLSFEHPFSGEVINLSINPSHHKLPLWKLAID
jgi:23S rRNA pseudouridine1911/1915/1917 synthase